MHVTFATSAGSGRSLLLQGGNVPNSEPGLIYKCSDYDNYSKDIASLVAKCPKGPKPVNLCLVGKARGGCSTKITDQFPGADCREQCTAYYWFALVWSTQWLCLGFCKWTNAEDVEQNCLARTSLPDTAIIPHIHPPIDLSMLRSFSRPVWIYANNAIISLLSISWEVYWVKTVDCLDKPFWGVLW